VTNKIQDLESKLVRKVPKEFEQFQKATEYLAGGGKAPAKHDVRAAFAEKEMAQMLGGGNKRDKFKKGAKQRLTFFEEENTIQHRLIKDVFQKVD